MNELKAARMVSLKRRAQKLVKMINLEVPESILAKQVAMVFQSGCCLVPETGAELAKLIDNDNRRTLGYCVLCNDNPNKSVTNDDLCIECLKAVEEASKE